MLNKNHHQTIPILTFFKLVKGLPIYSVKVEGLVFPSKMVKRLGDPTIVLNKALVEVTET